jgi:hypothetical protein
MVAFLPLQVAVAAFAPTPPCRPNTATTELITKSFFIMMATPKWVHLHCFKVRRNFFRKAQKTAKVYPRFIQILRKLRPEITVK